MKVIKEQLGGMAARFALTALLAVGFVLAGLIQYQITAAAVKYSPADYADYVAEAGFVTLFCKDSDASETAKGDWLGDEAEEEEEEGDGDLHNAANVSDWRRHIEDIKVPLTEDRRWELNAYEAFLWGSLLGPIIGSYLVSRLGPKRTIEGGLLGASVATLLVPAAWFTPSHYVLSIIQGVCTGMIWPAAHVFTCRWYPPAERTTIVSFYAAWTSGWAVAVLLGGPVVDFLGRDLVFYFTSLAVVCWYIAWQRYVPEARPVPLNPSWTEQTLISTPPEEPTISNPESRTFCCHQGEFPLKAFLLSGPMWSCAVASFGYHWGQTTLLLAVTKYLQIVYGFSMSYDGTLSYLPFLGHLVCAVVLGMLADHYRAQSLVTTTTVRKILVYISHFLPGAIIFVIGYTGCDPTAPAALFAAALGLNGATPAGVYTSALEISPKYSGAVLGFVQSVGALGALASLHVVKEGLYGALPGTWTLVFGLCFTVMVVTAGIFLIFGSGTEQQWNEPAPPLVSLLTIEQSNSNQQHESFQANQSTEVIEHLNRKNQVLTT